MGIGDENEPTGEDYIFGDQHTNGMQFTPIINNNNNLLSDIKVFDATNLMLMSYHLNQTESSNDLIGSISTVRYDAVDKFNGTGKSQNVSMAFYQIYSMYG